MTPADLGLSDEVADALDPGHVARVAATLDLPSAPSTLGPGWVWACFTPSAPTAALREDGHVAPPVGSPVEALPHRMFAGGRTTVTSPLRVGEAATREASISSAVQKQGRTGDFWLVTVRYEYVQGGSVAIVEEQDVLYRAATPFAGFGPFEPVADDWSTSGWDEHVPTTRLLFRFSALTFNTHRIHYDAAYARDVEGYPGLVVHGPLSAMWAAMRASVVLGRDLSSFSFRALSPAFVDDPLAVGARPGEAGTVVVRLRGPGGRPVMEATAS